MTDNEKLSRGAHAKPSFSPAKIALAAACALALVGGGVAAAYAGLFGQAEPAAPESVRATVKADGVLVAGPTLHRGDALSNVVPADELTGAYAGAYYRADFNGQTVYVAKRFVRLAGEEVPDPWTGYAAEDAIIFASPDLSGAEFLTLSPNEQVEVLDEFNGLLLVRNADGFEGYVPAGKILREPVPEPEPQVAAPSGSSSSSKGSSGNKGSSGSSSSSGSSGSSGSSSSGGSGGSSGGGSGGTTAPPSSGGGGSDGEEVGLPTNPVAASALVAAAPARAAYAPGARGSLFGVQVAYAAQPVDGEELGYGELPEGWTPADGARTVGEGDAVGGRGGEAADVAAGESATVLANGTESYLCLLNRGDVVEVKLDDQFGFEDRSLAEDASEHLRAFFDARAVAEGGEDEAADAAESGGFDAEADASEGAADSAVSAGAQTGPLSEEDRDSLAASEDVCTVLVNGQEASLPEKLLRLEGEVAYEAWDGFAAEGSSLYGDYDLAVPVQSLEVNAVLHVVDEIGGVLMVQTDAGMFFAPAGVVAKEQFEVVEEEPAEEVAPSSASSSSSSKGSSSSRPSSGSKPSSGGSGSSGSSGGSGSSGSGSSGGSGTGGGGASGGATDNTPEWSPPVL